jgi:hypothetical protein
VVHQVNSWQQHLLLLLLLLRLRLLLLVVVAVLVQVDSYGCLKLHASCASVCVGSAKAPAAPTQARVQLLLPHLLLPLLLVYKQVWLP